MVVAQNEAQNLGWNQVVPALVAILGMWAFNTRARGVHFKEGSDVKTDL